MRNLFLISIVVLLLGCATPPRFDNNEYQQIITIRVLVEDPQACNTSSKAVVTGIKIYTRIHYLRLYNEFSKPNQTFMLMIDEIENMATEFVSAYERTDNTESFPSIHYCKSKLRIIRKNIITLQQISRRKLQ